MLTRALAFSTISLSLLFVACGDDGGTENMTPLGGALSVSGNVHDFQTGAVVTGAATVSTTGLNPAPRITVEGASFVVENVPENSAFQILASVAGTHRATYSAAVEVTSTDVDGVKAYAVSETLLASLATAFNVTPTAAKGVLVLQLVDGAGNPKANVAGSNIVLANAMGASTVKFLDANLAAAPTAMASSASGVAVFFEVPPGTISLGQAANATATLTMATAPVGAGSVTLARVLVADGAPPALPTNVSFATQVMPIFSNRGCVACHSGGGVGKDLGGLMLDAGTNKVHQELTQENPARANPLMPEKSLVLTMPSTESPPDSHPNATFAGPQDPDYIKILVWLREGAKNN